MNNIKAHDKYVECKFYEKQNKNNDPKSKSKSKSKSKKSEKRKEKSEIRANKRAVHFMQQD